MVYATVGVALGIVVGTLIADGSLSATSLFASHQPVRAGSSTAGVGSHPAAKPMQAQPLTVAQLNSQSGQIQKSAPGKPSDTAQSSIPAQVPLPSKASIAVPAVPATQSALAARTSASMPPSAPLSKGANGALASVTVKAPSLSKTPTAQKVSTGRRHRAVRRYVSRSWHLGKHKGRWRYRSHPLLKEAVIQKPSPKAETPKFVASVPEPFVYFVEGNVTVANFDSISGTIDTYEGETFALNGTVAQTRTVSWLDYPPDVHYRCDQSWNCTLIHDGRVVLNAKRTK